MKAMKLTQVQEKILAAMKDGNEIHMDSNNNYKLHGYNKPIQRATIESLIKHNRIRKRNNRYTLINGTADRITNELNKPQKQRLEEHQARERETKRRNIEAREETRNSVIHLIRSAGQYWLDAGVDTPAVHDAAEGRLTQPWTMRSRFNGRIVLERSTLAHIAHNCRPTHLNSDLYNNVSTYCDIYGLSNETGLINWRNTELNYEHVVDGYAELLGLGEPVWHKIGSPLNVDLHYTKLMIGEQQHVVVWLNIGREYRTALKLFRLINTDLFESLGGNKINCTNPACRSNYREIGDTGIYRMYARATQTLFKLDPDKASLVTKDNAFAAGQLNYDDNGVMLCLRCRGPLLHPNENWDAYGYKRPSKRR